MNVDIKPELQQFIEQCRESQRVYAMCESASGNWVICDSAIDADTDVLPLWSEQGQAEQFCIGDWQDYTVASISVEELLETWVADLNYDGVLVGINWLVSEEQGEEMEPVELARAFAYDEIAQLDDLPVLSFG